MKNENDDDFDVDQNGKSSNYMDLSKDNEKDDDDFVDSSPRGYSSRRLETPSTKSSSGGTIHPFFNKFNQSEEKNYLATNKPLVFKSPKANILSKATQIAQKEEARRKRLLNSYKSFEESSTAGGHVVNLQRPVDDPELRLVPEISEKLKEHQLEAVRFMWTNVCGSVSLLRKENEAKEVLMNSETPHNNALAKLKGDNSFNGW